MTKERFIYLLEFIKDQHTVETNLCAALEACTDGCYCDALIYSKYETELIQTIKEALGMSEDNDDIEYFIYDLNFGKDWKPGAVTDNGQDIDFSSAEKLYEYLTGQADIK